MKIYVGNMSRQVTEDDLRKAFEAFAEVGSVNIVTDKFTGESRGFGFVEMPSKEEAQKAIEEMNGKELMDRAVNVSEAHGRPAGGRSNSRGGGRGGFGGRGGGRGGFGGSRGGGGRGGFGGGRGGDRGGNRY